MESRRWPETLCLPPSPSSHSRSLTQGRAESISAGEWKKSGFHFFLLFGFLFLPDKLWVLVEQVFYVFGLFFFSLSFLDRKSIMWIYLHLISVVINDKKCVMKLFRKKKNASLNSKTCNAILIFVKILLQKCYRSLYIPPRTGLIITITNMTVVRY